MARADFLLRDKPRLPPNFSDHFLHHVTPSCTQTILRDVLGPWSLLAPSHVLYYNVPFCAPRKFLSLTFTGVQGLLDPVDTAVFFYQVYEAMRHALPDPLCRYKGLPLSISSGPFAAFIFYEALPTPGLITPRSSNVSGIFPRFIVIFVLYTYEFYLLDVVCFRRAVSSRELCASSDLLGVSRLSGVHPRALRLRKLGRIS